MSQADTHIDRPMRTAETWRPLSARMVDCLTADTRLFLALTLLIGLVLRAGSMMFLTGAIDWEGAEYARLAENLRNGFGYVGIDMPGRNLMFPPLYPFLIAGVSHVVPDYELAARLISVTLGTGTILTVFLLARALFGDFTARIAAALIAIHPLLVHFSATAVSEPTFVFFYTLAAFLAVRALDNRRPWQFAVAGAAFGIAYLARIEGAPMVVITLAIALAGAAWRYIASRSLRALGRELGATALLPIAFLIVASPYIGFLYGETGQLRLEGKAPLNIETAKRAVLDKEPKFKVHYEVGSDLTERGVWNTPHTNTISTFRFDPVVLVHYLVEKAPLTVLWMGATLAGVGPDGLAVGTPVLTILVLVGLFVLLKQRDWRPGIFLLVGFGCLLFSQVFLIVFMTVRFFNSFIPILAVFAAVGAPHAGAWIKGKAEAYARGEVDRTRRADLAIVAGAAAILVIAHLAALNRPALWNFSGANPVREAAEALATKATHNRPILVGGNWIAYHANADYSPFPYADSATALRYFDRRGVSFIVIGESDLKTAPYLASWWQNGIPSPRAELIQEVNLGSRGKFRFYRWARKPAAS